jgi:capsular polysaccharide biosynthesis protein
VAQIVSLAELAAKPGSGVDHIRALGSSLPYDIPKPLLNYPGPIPGNNREWTELFCAQQTGYSPAIDLYRIDECLVTVDGAVMTLSNYIVKESLYPYVREHDIADAFNTNLLFPSDHRGDSIREAVRAFSRVTEGLFFAREHGEAGYFHWLHSVLPRVAQYRSCGLSKRPISLAITEGFQRESLDFMGLSGEDLFRSTGTSQLCSSLYFCTPMVSPNMNRSGGFFERALYASHMLRKLTGNPQSAKRKIFISRQDARIRRLVEEADVMKILAKSGFELFTLTGMPFKEQVALFSTAAVVVSMHGAGLSNAAFMPAGGVVVELLTPDRLWPTFRGVAVRSGQNYVPYVGNTAGTSARRDSDISVEVDRFARFVLDAAALVSGGS